MSDTSHRDLAAVLPDAEPVLVSPPLIPVWRGHGSTFPLWRCGNVDPPLAADFLTLGLSATKGRAAQSGAGCGLGVHLLKTAWQMSHDVGCLRPHFTVPPCTYTSRSA